MFLISLNEVEAYNEYGRKTNESYRFISSPDNGRYALLINLVKKAVITGEFVIEGINLVRAALSKRSISYRIDFDYRDC